MHTATIHEHTVPTPTDWHVLGKSERSKLRVISTSCFAGVQGRTNSLEADPVEEEGPFLQELGSPESNMFVIP